MVERRWHVFLHFGSIFSFVRLRNKQSVCIMKSPKIIATSQDNLRICSYTGLLLLFFFEFRKKEEAKMAKFRKQTKIEMLLWHSRFANFYFRFFHPLPSFCLMHGWSQTCATGFFFAFVTMYCVLSINTQKTKNLRQQQSNKNGQFENTWTFINITWTATVVPRTFACIVEILNIEIVYVQNSTMPNICIFRSLLGSFFSICVRIRIYK